MKRTDMAGGEHDIVYTCYRVRSEREADTPLD